MEGEFQYGVDSYQVPVPLGDGAMHFLVKRPTAAGTGKANKQPYIEVAILVDGGKDGGKDDDKETKSACDAIVNTLNTLEKEYGEWPGHEKKIPFPGFTVWLVTHWDDEHYLGALDYFTTVLKSSPKTVASPVPFDDHQWGAAKSRQSVGLAKSQLFRF